ncbi:hypothetical protein RUM44_010668 [Polyplax serrata]|uniref:Uncharacterized protein n=1 Tax=Polyplax serrata TaxID=468196 RepID=A0ABR1AMW8_POLSC
MKVYLLLLLFSLVGASEDINANEIKRRMKLIGGIPNYGTQNVASKMEGKANYNTVGYTEPKLILTYNASSQFSAKGMGHLYTVTRLFMNFLQPTTSYPDANWLASLWEPNEQLNFTN